MQRTPPSSPPRPLPSMWLSWKSIIKPRGAQGAVQSDSAMSTTSTAATPLDAKTAPPPPSIDVFGGDALASITEKYKLGKVIGKGEGKGGKNGGTIP